MTVTRARDDSSAAWAAPEGSWASSAANRRSMLGNRNRDTAPELALRRLVHAAGLRYRVAAKPLPGMRRTADLIFRPTRVAVFVDGCYWHGCPEHFVPPKTNPEYWREKIARNIQRTTHRCPAGGRRLAGAPVLGAPAARGMRTESV